MCSLPTPGHCKTPTAPLPQALHSGGQERSGRQARQGAGQTDSSPHLPALGHGVRSSGGLEEPQVWARGPHAFLWVLSPIPRHTWARPALATIKSEDGVRGCREAISLTWWVAFEDSACSPRTCQDSRGHWPRACHLHNPRELSAVKSTPATASAQPQPFPTETVPAPAVLPRLAFGGSGPLLVPPFLP